MNEGDVVLTPLPQANGRVKNRPAVALRELPPYGDLLAKPSPQTDKAMHRRDAACLGQ
jgi:mRNA interferase MazF